MQKLLFIFMLIPQFIFAQPSTKTIKSKVQKAIVFTQGAELFYTEKVTLPAGTSEVILEGISPNLNPESIQAGASGDAVLTEVRYHFFYTETAPKKEDPARKKLEREWRLLQDSIQEWSYEERRLQFKINNFKAERSVLTANRMMRGELVRDSLPIFTQSLDFLRVRLNEIDAQILQYDHELYHWTLKNKVLQERSQTVQTLLNGNYRPEEGSPAPVPQIILTLYSDKAISTDLTVHYFVAQAGWTSSYDLRANNNNITEIEINQKAKVWQKTGLDWAAVQLTLSTGNPSLGQNKPVLQPYIIGFQPIELKKQRGMVKSEALSKSDMGQQAPSAEAKEQEENFDDRDGVMDYTTVTENLLRVEYEISLPYTIASDGQMHQVQIQNKKVPANFIYSCVPKLDPDVFLMARIANWEDLNLIPGAARIYFDGSLVGESHLNALSNNDTLQLNFGRDKSIAVKRTKLKDKSKEKLLSDTKVIITGYEISVRNTKSQPIRLVIEDQMPVSNDAAIKIEYLEYSKAYFNEVTGKLTWELKIDAKNTKKVDFMYEIRHDKNKALFNQ